MTNWSEILLGWDGPRGVAYAYMLRLWVYGNLILPLWISVEKNVLTQILLLFVDCFDWDMILRCINFLIVWYFASWVGILLVPSEPSVNDIKTTFSQLLHSTPQVEVQIHEICFFCTSLICLTYHGNVTDHGDSIVRRFVRPGVTAVHLRLHPGALPLPSV